MNTDLCRNCRHWDRFEADRGLCRRNPPALVPEVPDCRSLWPVTLADDWCGAWAALPARMRALRAPPPAGDCLAAAPEGEGGAR